MLSDRDREVLRGVERRMLDEDPAFVRSFDARARRLLHPAGRVAIKIFVVAGMVLSAVVLVAGSVGGAVLFAVATGFVWLAWWLMGHAQRQPS